MSGTTWFGNQSTVHGALVASRAVSSRARVDDRDVEVGIEARETRAFGFPSRRAHEILEFFWLLLIYRCQITIVDSSSLGFDLTALRSVSAPGTSGTTPR